MRHQRRHGHRLEHAACYPTEHEFAQPGMPVTAHDHEARGCIRYVREQDVRNVDIGCDQVPELRLDAVTHEMICHGGVFVGLVTSAAHRDQIYMLGVREEG